MGARQKLNGASFMGSLLVAGVCGTLTESWLVFAVALIGLLIASVCTGEFRPTAKGRRR